MKFYLASGYSWRHVFAKELRPALEKLGHEVTSRWIDIEDRLTKDAGENEYAPWARNILTMNQHDMRCADALILDTNGVRKDGNGGAHYEVGFMRALGKQLFIVGKRLNTFHWDDEIIVVKDYNQLLKILSS